MKVVELETNIEVNESLRPLFDRFVQKQLRLVILWRGVFERPTRWELKGGLLRIFYGTNQSTSKLSNIERIYQITHCLLNDYVGGSTAELIDGRLAVFPDIFRIERNRDKKKKNDIEVVLSLINDTKELDSELKQRISHWINNEDYLKVINTLDELREEVEVSIFDLITEAELLVTMSHVFRYTVVERVRDYVDLELNHKYKDSLIDRIRRSDLPNLWTDIIGEGYVSKEVVLTTDIPYPALGLQNDQVKIDLKGIDLEKKRIRIHRQAGIKRHGFCFFYDNGSQVLYRRKRMFTRLANSNRQIQEMVNSPANRPFLHNKISRSEFIQSVLNEKGMFCVQGPPGTGKTYLATEIISQYLKIKPQAKILVSSKEHYALDHLLLSCHEKIGSRGFRPLRLLSKRREERMNGESIEKFLLRERKMKAREIRTWKRGEAILSDFPDNRVEYMAIETSNVIFVTTSDGSLVDMIDNSYFDLVVVEETGKCYPSELLHLSIMGDTILMIGDQHQLPPYQVEQTSRLVDVIEELVSRSDEKEVSKRFGNHFNSFSTINFNSKDKILSWFHPFREIFNNLPEKKRFRLENQYRMPKSLSDIIGKVFYNGKFHHKKKRKATIPPLKFLEDSKLVWIDVPHILDLEETGEQATSRGERSNSYEIEVLKKILTKIRRENNPDIVVITPYSKQKQLILSDLEIKNCLSNLYGDLWKERIRTTDEFQGHEADFILISLVRNNTMNADSAWGFISSPQRLNVMFSRAREGLVVIGSQAHIERNKEGNSMEKFFEFLEEFRELGKIIKAEELLGG